MAEAETEGKTLTYDQIESIIENDQVDDDDLTKSKKPKPAESDLAMWLGNKGKGKGKGAGKGGGAGWHSHHQHSSNWQPNWRPSSSSSWQQPSGWKGGDKGTGKGGGKGKHTKGKPDSAGSLQELKSQQLQQLKAMQQKYDETKKKADEANWANDDDDDDYWRQQQQSSSSGTEITDEGYWSMWDGAADTAWAINETDGTAAGHRAIPPLMGKDKVNNISRKLGSAPSMHAKIELLHAHLHVPDGHKLDIIPVDSGCAVTNIDHDRIIHADQMSHVGI